MYSAAPLQLRMLLLWAAPLAGLACGGGTDVVLPPLRIATITTGVEIDPDGYSISIDGQAAQLVGPNATLVVDGIADGQHTVELTGIAGNCAVGGQNPQSVSVTAGATASLAFEITCSSAAGSIQVTTTTSATGGGEIDPDGYSISIDGQPSQAIGLNATLTVDGIADGSHTVALSGIAGNCGVGGQNPQAVSVLSGSTASLSFEITCSAGTGSIQVVTAASGAGTDPDGFVLLLDGTDRGPIGVSATSSLTGITAGSHSIGLTGLAGNCQISGENPRTVSVPAGGTAQVAFAVACAAPGATTGNLQIVTVTTGPSQDANGYLISIDGGAGQPIATNTSVTLSNVTAILHTVELQGLAPNCGVSGGNPLGVAVGAGETARVEFRVTCAATLGSLQITITGLPAATPAAITVSGPNGFSQTVTSTRTLTGLMPGSYRVNARDVVAGAITYTASVSSATVAVAAGASPAVTVSYTGPAVPPLNLRIQGLYLTQSTQTLTSSVPLVVGRAGFLRVFVLANEAGNRATPTVRVRFRNGSSPVIERTINAPGEFTPTAVQEGALGSSWNLSVEAALIRPGLSIEATVDPTGAIAESNENDNGSTKALTVRTVSTARVLFVPVQQGSSDPGNVTTANKDQLVALARKIYPLNSIETQVRSVYSTTGGPLQFDGGGWDQVLSELEGLRVDEGSDQTYFGVVKLGYAGGKDGNAFQGELRADGPRAAMGTDAQSSVGRVVAHELGHTWGQLHTPCGGPPNVDVGYPYGNGIGVYGFDVAAGTLKPPSTPDIMGYCTNPWISDYTYSRVMNFRASQAALLRTASNQRQPALLIWGRIVNGRPILEPAFEIVTRPELPRRPGPYSLSATAVDGAQLFSLSFDVAAVEDQAAGSGHFAFAVPLDQARTARLGNLRLQGPTGGIARSRTLAQLREGATSQSIVARRVGENVSLQWSAAAHPMIIVRDPDTGEILSFARGGSAMVRTAKGELDLDVSDGVRSQRVRVAINRS